jgi:uncharacterized protein (DUF3084 family)
VKLARVEATSDELSSDVEALRGQLKVASEAVKVADSEKEATTLLLEDARVGDAFFSGLCFSHV